MLILLSFLLFVSTSIDAQTRSVKSTCTKQMESRADVLVSKILTIGNPDVKFPDNNGQVPKYCSEILKNIKAVDNYTKTCLESSSRQVATILVFTLNSQFKQLCAKDTKRRQELLDAATCGNRGSSEIQKCNVKIIDAFLGIQNAQNHKLKIPYICCEYYKFKACVAKRLTKVDSCSEKRIEVVLRFISSLFANSNDFLCSEYEEGTDKCTPLVTPRKRKNQRRPKSYFKPLIDIIASIP